MTGTSLVDAVILGYTRGLPFNLQGGGGQSFRDGPNNFFTMVYVYDPADIYFFSSSLVIKIFFYFYFGMDLVFS